MALNKVQIAGDDVAAELVPERGGIVNRLTIGGDEVFYLDPATLDTPRFAAAAPSCSPTPARSPAPAPAARGTSWASTASPASYLAARRYRRKSAGSGSSPTTTRERPDFDVRIIYRCSGSTFTVEAALPWP